MAKLPMNTKTAAAPAPKKLPPKVPPKPVASVEPKKLPPAAAPKATPPKKPEPAPAPAAKPTDDLFPPLAALGFDMSKPWEESLTEYLANEAHRADLVDLDLEYRVHNSILAEHIQAVHSTSFEHGGKFYQIRKRGDLYYMAISDAKFGRKPKPEDEKPVEKPKAKEAAKLPPPAPKEAPKLPPKLPPKAKDPVATDPKPKAKLPPSVKKK